jgi:hypothetical protein
MTNEGTEGAPTCYVPSRFIAPNALYVDWGSRFVGDMNWCSVVGTDTLRRFQERDKGYYVPPEGQGRDVIPRSRS